jgi:hypothetical protein
MEEHPWRNLGCQEATMALAVGAGDLAQAARSGDDGGGGAVERTRR